MNIAAFFVGELHDHGFNASALLGVEQIRAAGEHQIELVSGVPYELESMRERLEQSAQQAELVLFIGGQGDRVTPEVAALYPEVQFAVIQGSVMASNVSSYEVCQEQSAFLAGVLAASESRSGVVAHLSGHRVKPGLKGRAAFVAGVQFANPEVEVLTAFCGTQDDNHITQHWAEAQFAAGADILFTMLNGARAGAIEACKTHRAKQIGNAMDWCTVLPEVFIASAIARIDVAIHQAVADASKGRMPAHKTRFGLEHDQAVCLKCCDAIKARSRNQLEAAEQALSQGLISLPHDYSGAEFSLPESAA